jgi:hypothetical protein
MTDRRLPSVAAIVVASVIAAAGMVAHNVFEFGPAFVLNPETLIPLAIFGLLAVLALAMPANAIVHVLLLAWAVLNLVGGGILSVLPLGLFPFQPRRRIVDLSTHLRPARSSRLPGSKNRESIPERSWGNPYPGAAPGVDHEAGEIGPRASAPNTPTNRFSGSWPVVGAAAISLRSRPRAFAA